MNAMTWLQVALLCLTILGGIVGSAVGVVRPLMRMLIQTMVVDRLDAIEAKVDAVTKDHGDKILDLQLKHSRLLGSLETKGCLSIPKCVTEG